VVGIKLEYTESIVESEKLNDIWNILCECDKEFVPPLSARESSYQSNLTVEENNDVLPHSYYEVMMKQHFILAIEEENGKVVGFMTFKNGYSCPELENYSPSNYITTICVQKAYRNYGITRKFYSMIQSDALPSKVKQPFISTRTWSTNDAHLHVLDSIGFKVSERLIDHRGPSIDTVYFAKAIE
jgi:ribosomal protein S18 acetylase RimI-like enzyme